MPALAKLGAGPNSSELAKVGSAFEISIFGKTLLPKRLMPKSLGVNDWPVVEYARIRVNPTFCCQVSEGVRTTVLSMDATWLPAAICCGNPSRSPVDPNGF